MASFYRYCHIGGQYSWTSDLSLIDPVSDLRIDVKYSSHSPYSCHPAHELSLCISFAHRSDNSPEKRITGQKSDFFNVPGSGRGSRWRHGRRFRRSFGMMIMESTLSVRLAIPASACFMRLAPSKRKGFVTTPLLHRHGNGVVIARIVQEN